MGFPIIHAMGIPVKPDPNICLMPGWQLAVCPLGKDHGLIRTTSHATWTEEGSICRRALYIQEQEKLECIPALKHIDNIDLQRYSNGIASAWDVMVAGLFLVHLKKIRQQHPRTAIPKPRPAIPKPSMGDQVAKHRKHVTHNLPTGQ